MEVLRRGYRVLFSSPPPLSPVGMGTSGTNEGAEKQAGLVLAIPKRSKNSCIREAACVVT